MLKIETILLVPIINIKGRTTLMALQFIWNLILMEGRVCDVLAGNIDVTT